jgi:biotin carboxyl carrier protein
MVGIKINDEENLSLEKIGSDLFINGDKNELTVELLKDNSYKVFSKTKIYHVVIIEKSGNQLVLSIDGEEIKVSRSSHVDRVLEKLGMSANSSTAISDIKAPMPGTILSIDIKDGDSVNKGETILILEAMKMENVIKSPGDGVIKFVSVSVGDNVEKNQLLISLE